MAPRRVTGLQREVLQLYKRALKMVASKPEVRAHSMNYAF